MPAPKLSEEVTARMCQVLRAGGYVESAAQVAGIDSSTFRAWMRRGDPDQDERKDDPYREFRRRIEQARAQAEERNVTLINRAAIDDWRAAAWLLERQYPDTWARVSQRAEKDADQPSSDDPLSEVDELANARLRRGTTN